MEKETKSREHEIFEQNAKMLEYFQNEFMYRHTHYWNLLIKIFILTIIVAILPLTSEALGIAVIELAVNQMLIFPMISLVIAIYGFIVLLDEAKKMRAVNNAKYRINKQMDEKHQYDLYNPNVGKKEGVEKKDKKNWLVYKITYMAFIVELLIIFFATLFIILK